MKKHLIKKAIYIFSVLFVGSLSYAQTTSENYVQTRTYLEEVTTSSSTAKQVQTVQYFDGLGRPKQVVNVKASPLGKDLVTPIVYDGFGRQTRQYLPVPQSGTQNGLIYSQATGLTQFPVADATNIYNGEKTYSEAVLENSPLDRSLQQIQIGNDWANKPINFEYGSNIQADNVKKYETTTTWDATNKIYTSNIQQSVNYTPGQLYKNTVIDEDGNKTIEFKNGRGQTLLVRKVINTTENADTYYVYNEYNQLSYVIPPLAATSLLSPTALENYCYQYKYDSKSRLVEKKLPGKGWEYMAYDKADRLILSQDANLRNQNKWLLTKYDGFGRVAYTGIQAGGSRTSMQNQITDLVISETRNTTGFSRNGMIIYYTNAYFHNLETVLSVNYYDTYPELPGIAFPTSIFNQEVLKQLGQSTSVKNTKGLPVASYVKNIEDDKWTINFNWFDTRGRVIGTHSLNHLEGYTKTESELDFAGAVKKTITYHKRLRTDTEKVITENFTYDNQNRLLVHKHKVDNNTEEILAQNTYNELSQLINKKVGNTISTPLQDIDYKYNIRGWMTKINDPANLNGKLFGYEIKYNNPSNTSLSTGKYNGNIAEIDWRKNVEFGNMGTLKRYNYSYDKLNRLTDAIFSNPNNSIPVNNLYDELISYDLNGNITQLKRNAPSFYGTAELIDDLYYDYEGNRLNSVNDDNSNPSGYEGGGNSITYDDNGNIYNHPDKLIDEIGYNHLNLPNAIRINQNENKILYLYRADGTKLRKATYLTSVSEQGTILSGTVTEYLDGFHYLTTQGISKNDDNPTDYAYEQEAFINQMLPSSPTPTLQFFPTAEGFYDYVNNKYIYQYKDHLGNVRVSYKGNTNGEVEITDQNDYYPFGMSFIRNAEEQAFFGTANYQNYKYNGKELQESGMYDYGARFYMPDLGRWGVVDLLSELQFEYTPYAYTNGNPIRFSDPTGMIGDCEGCPRDRKPNEKGGVNNPIEIEGVVITTSKAVNFVMRGIEGAYDSVVDMLTFTGERQIIKDSYNSINSLVNPNAPSSPITQKNPNDFLCLTGNCPEFELEDLDPYMAELKAMYEDAKNGNGYRTGYNITALLAILITHKGKTLRNGSLAGDVHPKTGVPFKSPGFPDFSEHLYPGGPNDVTITPTGKRYSDFSAANKAAGYKSTPKGYTWHHHEDTGRMQLVETKIHKATAHTGGYAIWDIK